MHGFESRGLIISWAIVAAWAVTAGCQQRPAPAPPASAPTAKPVAVELTVAVVDDEDLAEGMKLLRGEWSARSGGTLAIESVLLEALIEGALPAADVIVFPSRHLGTLAERGDLRSMRSSVLDSAEYGLGDIYPAIRTGEMKYGGQTLALPLGSPPLLACYRADVVNAHEGKPPRNWGEFRQVVAAGKVTVNEGDPSSAWEAMPLAGRAAAYTLLIRGVSYTEPQRRSEAMFEARTLAPRIAKPPFVRALDEIAQETARRRDEPPADFAAAVRLLRNGRAGVTFGWPGLAAETVDFHSNFELRFAAIPVADDLYSENQRRWENQSFGESVTFMGMEGRLVGVTTATRNATSAFKLCQWLTSGDAAVQVSARSTGTLWFRKSQASQQGRWLHPTPQHAQDEGAAEAAIAALESDAVFLVPRIPGIDDYLEALAEEVRRAAAGEVTAAEALDAAAERWVTITDKLGRAGQLRSYLRHLGLDAWAPRP